MISEPVFRCAIETSDHGRLYFTDGDEATLDPAAAPAKSLSEWARYGREGDLAALRRGKPPLWMLTEAVRIFEPMKPTK